MWKQIVILIGVDALIVLSYAWVWVIAAGATKFVSAERMGRPTKADFTAVLGVMALWTLAWTVMVIMDLW